MRNIFVFTAILISTHLSAQVVIDTLDYDPTISVAQAGFKNSLAIDPSDNVWIGYETAGAARWDNSSWTRYTQANSGMPSDNALCFAFAGSTAWIGTDAGVARFASSVWTVFDSVNSALETNYIRCLMTDGNNLWLGTNHGAYYFNGSMFTKYSTGNSGILSDSILCIGKTAGGIWFGTNIGLSRFNSGTFTNFTTSNSGLRDGEISKLVTDGNDDLWIEVIYPDPANDLRQIYFSADGNSIIPATEYFRSCQGIPVYNYLIGKDQSGNAILATTRDFTTNPAVIMSISATSNEKYLSSHNSSIFNYFTSGVSVRPKQFAISSNDKIWMIYPIPNNRKIYSLDYFSTLPGNVEDNCYQLDGNQVLARISTSGSMFYDESTSGKYEVPAGSGKIALRESAVWIGAMDSTGFIRTAIGMNSTNKDFWPGPLDTINASIDSSTMMQYSSPWKVHRDTVLNFLYQFNLGNVGNGTYTVPDELLDWPAHGSGNYSRFLAPFVDVNADGVYDPYDGDYPDVKGSVTLWWVFNDNYSIHTLSDGSVNLGLEIQCTAYAYDCPNATISDSVINYTTFFHYEIFNRSDTAYQNAYAGIFTDVDLGNPIDDYLGCDTVNDFSFVYNGDDDDYGIPGYGLHPPMVSNAILRGPDAGGPDNIDNDHDGVTDESGEYNMMNHFMFFNDNFDPVAGNPNGAEDFYSYMKSIWRNGAHLTYGGNGHGGGPGATTDSTNYMFSGTPYGSGWTEAASGNIPSNRRFLTSSGPFLLPARGKASIDFAYVFTRNETGPNGVATSVATNLQDVLKVKQWFDNDSFPCANSLIGMEEIAARLDFSLYPNPATSQITVSVSNRNQSGRMSIEILNVLGERVYSNQYAYFGNKKTIDLSGISPGLYLLKVSIGEKSNIRKFVIGNQE